MNSSRPFDSEMGSSSMSAPAAAHAARQQLPHCVAQGTSERERDHVPVPRSQAHEPGEHQAARSDGSTGRRRAGLAGSLALVLAAAMSAPACGGPSDDGPSDDGPIAQPPLGDRAPLAARIDPLLLQDRLPFPDSFFESQGISREHEITALRSASSYTFRRPDGSMVMAIGAGLDNYVDAFGRYRPIELSVKSFDGDTGMAVLARPEAPMEARAEVRYGACAAADGSCGSAAAAEASLPNSNTPFTAAYASIANNPRSYFPENPAEGIFLAFDSGNEGRITTGMRWVPTRRLLDLPGGGRDELSVSTSVRGEPEGNKMRYAGTYPGVIEEYTVQPGRTKHDIILLAPPAAEGYSDRELEASKLTFDGTLVVSPGLVPVVDGVPRTGSFITSSPIQFLDENGRVAFHLGRPHAYEQGDPTVETIAWYRVTVAENGAMTLGLATPLSWLLAPERVYPVVVDPGAAVVASYSCDVTDAGAKRDDGAGGHYNIVGHSDLTTFRAAIKFPLDGISPGTVITDVSLQVFVQLANLPTTRIVGLSNDPVAATGATIYDEIASSTAVYAAESPILRPPRERVGRPPRSQAVASRSQAGRPRRRSPPRRTPPKRKRRKDNRGGKGPSRRVAV